MLHSGSAICRTLSRNLGGKSLGVSTDTLYAEQSMGYHTPMTREGKQIVLCGVNSKSSSLSFVPARQN